MAKEAAGNAYVPVLIGSWEYDEGSGDDGGWWFELSHDVLLAGEQDQAIAQFTLRDKLRIFIPGSAGQQVITALAWQPNPGEKFHSDMWAGLETLKQVQERQAALRDEINEALPF